MSGNATNPNYYNGRLEIESRGETNADAIALENQADHEVHHVSKLTIFKVFINDVYHIANVPKLYVMVKSLPNKSVYAYFLHFYA